MRSRLGFALLLKAFLFEGRFPRRSDDLPRRVVAFVAHQIGVLADLYSEVDWSERTVRYHKVQIRLYLGVREFTLADAEPFVAWLSARVTSPDPQSEALKVLAHEGLRTMKLEPPTIARLTRLLHAAVARFEAQIFQTLHTSLSPDMRLALDLLVSTGSDLDDDLAQPALFPLRSDLATLKDDAGAVKIDTVLEELAKLKQLRALNLPVDLFRTVPPKFVAHYRQRAATEKPRELRRHPPEVRATLLAALCWQRQREITDTLVELLLHIAHRIGVRAEDKVDGELLKYAKRVVGKTKLLYKVAKAAKQGPDDTVRNVIYGAVGEQTLDQVIQEVEADESYERRVQLVTRGSYSHHYRRIIPALLDVLQFQCNNERHRPMMDALALLRRYRDHKTAVFPLKEAVPLDGVVKADWQDLVRDAQHGGRVNRISYEVCLLTTLREKVRCKEIWVVGAYHFRNPDEDLPQDFDARRDDYYADLKQPREAKVFVDAGPAVARVGAHRP